ncbi:MAG: HIT family protein [Hyphomicrobiales bacterium]|nr:MAG: HIT family protein [Hyphomicrobiales bacterium]
MSYDPDNIFAKIMRGEIPCHKIYEDAHNFAFLDIMPRAPGHTLVIPKTPAVNLLDIAPDDLCELMRAVHKLAPVVKQAMGADGLMIQQFNEAAAGQMVFHIHFHIVPRYAGTPLKAGGQVMEDDALLQAHAAKIREALAG